MVKVIAQCFPRTIAYKGEAETIEGARGSVVLALGLVPYKYDWRDEAGRIVILYYRTGPRETFKERQPFMVVPCDPYFMGVGRALRL